MSIFVKLWLLAWKYYRYRTYYWIWTIAEFFLPVCFIYLVITFSETFIGIKTTLQPSTVQKMLTFGSLAYSVQYDVVCYSPDSRKATEIIKTTLRHINNLQGYGKVKYFFLVPLPNELDLVTYMSRHNKSYKVVGIVFLSLNHKFEYKIRDNEYWNTNSLYLKTEAYQNGPHFEEDPYYTKGFAAMKFYLDYIYIQRIYPVYPKITLQNATFQPFPYPEYSKTTPYRYLLPIVAAFSVVITSLMILGPLLIAIINEKSNGLNEIMGLAGLSERLIWISWYISTLIPGIFIYTIITIIFLYDYRGLNYAIIRYLQPSLLWSIVILYFTAQLAFCLFFAALFHTKITGVTTFCVITLSLGYGALKVHDYHNMILVHLSCLTPVGALIQGFKRITYSEVLDLHITWSYLFLNEFTAADASLGFVIILLVLDTGIYCFLAYYVKCINPGKFGLRKSLLFLFQKSTAKIERLSEESDKDDIREANSFKETVPTTADLILVVQNLSKKFGSTEAVKGISFSLLRNEIFVIVGNPNAGKTTTLSTICGLLEPTSGKIFYKGKIELLRSILKFSRFLGFCPEKNRLFPYFTVIDHLVFYGMLKGADKQEAIAEGSLYLQLMGLYTNAEDVSSLVSSEMKRKLSLSIALMGHSEILVLDEPVTGLDAIAQKKILNLLKDFKEDRTIIVTTPSIQEAIFIGDRIGILNNGVLVCQGSIEFLEKTFATGYDVKIKKKRTNLLIAGKKDPIALVPDEVRKIVPGLKVINETSSELFLNLPKDTSKFPVLFQTLEGKKSEFNIDTIGVSFTSLEKVYSKIGGDSIYGTDGKPLQLSEYVEQELKSREAFIKAEENGNRLTGVSLLLEQHRALFMKKFLFTYRNWFPFLYRVFIPTILMTIFIWGTVKYDIENPPLLLSMKSYPNSKALTMQNVQISGFYSHLLFYFSRNYIEHLVMQNTTINDALLEYGRQNINSYRRDLIMGADIFESSGTSLLMLTLLYNKFTRHSLPIVIDTFTNAVFTYNCNNISSQIITYNHPIKVLNVSSEQDKFNINVSETSPVITVWYILIVFFTIDLLDFISTSAAAERVDGFKHIQFLSNVSPFTYWTNTFLFDFIFFFIIMFFRLAFFKAFDQYDFFTFRFDFLIIILLILLFMASGLLFMYLISFFMKERSGAYAFFIIFNLFCSASTFTFYKYETSFLKVNSIWSEKDFVLSAIKFFILLVPPMNYNLAFEKYLTTWRVNHLVAAYTEHESSDQSFNVEHDFQYTPYLEFASESNPNGILGEMLFSILNIIFYTLLIFNVEFDYLGNFLNKTLFRIRISRKKKSKQKPPAVSDDVLAERATVKDTLLEKQLEKSNIVLIVRELRKIYKQMLTIFDRQKIAVDDVTFLVKSGECFGVIGSEGSGKTTTLKMLAGEITPTKGDAWIMKTKLSANRTEYFAKAGYCAQTDSFLKELTGTEILHIVAALHGIFRKNRTELIEKWISILGLENVVTQTCSTYSVGSRRKICVALALLGDPNVVFLDAPMSNIDPISRRSIYSLFEQMKSMGQVIVLSSRSMQECEALCDRFTILIEGEMKFVGSAAEMRQKHAGGISLLVIIKELGPSKSLVARADEILQLKYAIMGKFIQGKCILIEETETSLLYTIDEDLQWGDLFKRLENVKKKLKLVEEYQVSEKSLEEVFTRFVKKTIK